MSESGNLLDPVRRYLTEPRCAVLATIRPDGALHQVVVHYALDQASLILNGRADRRWLANLHRDPRCSIMVHDAGRPLHWVSIKASAEQLRTGDAAVGDAMEIARRYGEDPAAYQDQERVSYRIVPERVFEYG